jgi:hypothetical protein
MPDSIPLYIVEYALALTNNSTLDSSQEQRNNTTLLNLLNQTLNEPEKVNATSRDKAVYNQTILATNGTNDTSTNVTSAEKLANASRQQQQQQQQPQAPLQPLLSLLPAPSQLQQQPSTLQQQQPSLPPPLNLIPSPLSPQQQPPLPLIRPSQQLPPPIMQPSQQPSTIIPPPSTPLYPVPSFPPIGSGQAFNSPSPMILSQYSYLDNTGSIHIVGEVLNQAPVTARFVKVIATFYNPYGQVVGTESTYANPSQLGPGQRAPFEMIALGGSMPMYQMGNYALRVDWQP